MSTQRQFGKSTFKPTFGGVGASGHGDEENLKNAIIDDGEAGDQSASTAKSSAAFLNATSSSATTSSALRERYGGEMEVEVEEDERVPPSEEDPLPASTLDDVLNDDNSDSGDSADTSGHDVTENASVSANNETSSPSKSSAERANAEDEEEAESDDDMVGMSQVTSTQKTIDEMFDSESDDDAFPPATSQSQGATQSQGPQKAPAALGQLDDENLFSDDEGDAVVEAEGSIPQEAVISGTAADMDVEGVDLHDNDSLGDEVARSQDTAALADSDSDSDGAKKSKKSKKSKKLKKAAEAVSAPTSPETSVPKRSVVDQEIEAKRAIDEGPTEEDLQRRAVLFVDPDELDRRADAFNREMWGIMQKTLVGADEQRTQLKDIRAWFRVTRQGQDAEVLDYIRDELVSALKVIRGGEGERYYAQLEQYLSRAEDPDASDEDYIAGEGESVTGANSNETGGAEVIEFSDSDSDSDSFGEEDDKEGEVVQDPAETKKTDLDGSRPVAQEDVDSSVSLGSINLSSAIAAVVPGAVTTDKEKDAVANLTAKQSTTVMVMHTTAAPSEPAEVTPDDKRHPFKPRDLLKHRFAQASRGLGGKLKGNMKSELKRKQKAKIGNIAMQSYSRIFCRKIDLMVQKEITAKCRALSDLFFQRIERKLAVKKMKEAARRERLRRDYQAQADDDEEELDDYLDADEERYNVGEMTEEEQLAAQQQFLEEGAAVEEEEGDEEGVENEEMLAAADEGNEMLYEGEDDGKARAVDGMEVSPEDEEDEEIVLARQMAPKKSYSVEDEDKGDSTQSQGPASGPGATQSQLGVGLDEEILRDDDDNEDVEVMQRDAREAALAAAKARAKKAGKSLYQMQVEEEERRARNEKRGGLFDTEAEEEEETGMQAGLEDFGFGTSKQREGDEEREALKMRRDDFKGIADDLSDDEKEGRDEDAAARFRAKQQELDDMIASKRIIKGDLSKKNRSKGLLSEDFLAGEESRAFDPEADAEEQIEAIEAKLKEYSEEELLQQIQEEKRQKELAMALARGDSDSEGELDSDEDDENDPDEAFMTEAQKQAHRAEKARLREQKQKARIQQAEFKAQARTRRFLRQESTRKARQELLRQNSALSAGGSAPLQGAGQSAPALGPPLAADVHPQVQLKRSASTALGGRGPGHALSRQNSTKQSMAADSGLAMPRLSRSKSFSGAEGKNTLIRQQTFNGGGELGNDRKLSFKRQRSHMSAKASTNVVAASSTNMGAARNFMFRNNSVGLSRQDSQGSLPSAANASFAPVASVGPAASALRRKGSLHNALKKVE